MFGNKSDVNSRNYKYGARVPTENLKMVEDQFYFAHKYRNQLVEIELKRRESWLATIRTMVPEVADLEAEINQLSKKIEKKLEEVSKKNQLARKKSATKKDRVQLNAMKKERKKIWQRLKEARKGLQKDPAVETELKRVNEEYLSLAKKARSECGLYWGTYLQVEQGLSGIKSGTAPKFHRWDGNGKIAVQIQHGMTIDQAFSCVDNRFRLSMVDSNAFGKKNQYAMAWMRIGSEKSNPIWTTIPVRLHRELPKNTIIKWVYLLRRRIGTNYKWWMVLVLANAFDKRIHAKNGCVSVSLGWKLDGDGNIQVAKWRKKHNGEIDGVLIISKDDVGRWRKAIDLKSTRDLIYNEIIDYFKHWRSKKRFIPKWLAEKTKTIHAWRSTARLAALVLQWRENRFKGDTIIYGVMDEWRKKDRHLLEWESNQRRKAVAWRECLYKDFAAQLATRFRKLKIGNVDWKKLSMLKGPEEESDIPEAARWYRTIAAPGRLNEILRDRFKEIEIVERPRN